MRSIKYLLGCALAVAAVQLVAAHICMFSPTQRGNMQLDQPGDPSCSHKGPDPCGGINVMGTITAYTSGQQVDLQFQQNLNHFYSPNPGTLSAHLAIGTTAPTEADFQPWGSSVLPDWNAMDEVSMVNLTIGGVMPHVPGLAQAVLRLTYASNNPGENDTSTNFFQCADITIAPSNIQHSILDRGDADKAAAEAAPAAAQLVPSAFDCESPSQFEMLYQEVSTFAGSSGDGGMVSYDAKNRLIFSQLPAVSSGVPHKQHFQNFSSGIEWLWDPSTGACSAYGLDEWNVWGYGASQNEMYLETVTLGAGSVNLFLHPQADMVFGASNDALCTPVLRQHLASPHNQDMILYFNVTLGIENSDVFVPPQQCHSHHAFQLVQHGSIEEIRAYARALPRSTMPGHKIGGNVAAPVTGHKQHAKPNVRHIRSEAAHALRSLSGRSHKHASKTQHGH